MTGRLKDQNSISEGSAPSSDSSEKKRADDARKADQLVLDMLVNSRRPISLGPPPTISIVDGKVVK